MSPKLSIITVNLNNSTGLQNTIESVINQDYENYELIIIDGGSKDGSVEVIKKYTDKLAYSVSEPDTGIYNAMNKGIKHANGEYCLFLNSGDYLLDKNVLQRVFSFDFSEDLVFGDLIVEDGTKVLYPDHPSIFYVFKYSLPHQASLIKKKLLEDVGLYNENYKIISDWEFYMKAMFKYKCSYKHLDIIMAVYTLGGISGNNYEYNLNEKKKSMSIHFPELSDVLFQYMQAEKELSAYKNSRVIKLISGITNSKVFKIFRKH